VLATFYRLKYFSSASPFIFGGLRISSFSSFLYFSAVPFSSLSEMSKPVTLVGPIIHKGPQKITYK
jgi:hypothetical protein